ncbi:hypothetical protein [Streptomyces sp. NPDC096105]|uniref:hypothetical protein n=1 Tax=Streptomyces sp. NPDC096105 TaxID=3366074 RepID=UPI003816B04D
MPEPGRRKYRNRFVAWAVVCVAGLAATDALTGSPPSGGTPTSSSCADRIAEIEARLAELGNEDTGHALVAFADGSADTGHDCDDELREHFDGDP